jgi:AsmA protein
MKKIMVKILKIAGIVIACLLLVMLLISAVLSHAFDKQVKIYANRHLKSEMNYRDSKLSFFNHFPTLTLTLYDFSLMGAPPFQKDTLVSTREIALGVDLLSIFSGNMTVNRVYFSDGTINIKISEDGAENYDIYATSDSTTQNKSDAGKETRLKIEKLLIENTTLSYDDRSFPMMFKAVGFNYSGTGDLSKSVFDLTSKADIASFDFNYDNQYYFESKKIHGDLVTQINTNSLAVLFKRNDLKINELPVDFTGMFAFLEEGYSMDFKVESKNTELKNMVTALPKEYIQWMQETDLRGIANMSVRLSGKYIDEKELKPDLSFSLDIRDGYISHNKAPEPLQNLYFDFTTTLPALNPDSVSVDVDSISFNIEKGYLGGMLHVKGLTQPHIETRMHTALDLAKVQRATGIEGFDMKGDFGFHLLANGNFMQAQNPNSSVPDTIITSIPSFELRSSIRNGHFKNNITPQPVKNISFDVTAGCADHNYKNTNLSVKNLNVNYVSNYVKGFFDYYGGAKAKVDANLTGLMQLASLEKIYPMDSLDIQGDLRFDIVSKGNIDPDKKQFPATNAHIRLANGAIRTQYYPRPIEKINMDVLVHSADGSPKNTSLFIKPLSFFFESQPFNVKASLINFDQLKYDVSVKGAADLGHLSKVFAIDDLDYTGYVSANMTMRGNERDVKLGQYNKLYNTGTLAFGDIEVKSKYFPLPFHINEGKFHFNHDTLLIDTIAMKYGKSDLTLNGHIDNIFNYYFENDAINGGFTLESDLMNINEFMAAAESTSSSQTITPANASATQSGVVIIPPNLNITVAARAKKVLFSNLVLSEAKADMSLQAGTLKIKESGFTLIDAPVTMEVTYNSIKPTKAYFDYHILAKSFDIKRAYKEISLFREMVTSAATAQGVVSLDYTLKGKLDAGMSPIFPSLEGGGTLSVHKAKIKGFKLFTAISKASEKDSLNNPDVSNIEIKTTIKNNVITLLPLKMRVAGFRPKIQGQTSFDGKLNLKFRLGLPPLGIVGIPFNITGTQEKPIVKMGRGKNNEPLTETTDEDTE